MLFVGLCVTDWLLFSRSLFKTQWRRTDDAVASVTLKHVQKKTTCQIYTNVVVVLVIVSPIASHHSLLCFSSSFSCRLSDTHTHTPFRSLHFILFYFWGSTGNLFLYWIFIEFWTVSVLFMRVQSLALFPFQWILVRFEHLQFVLINSLIMHKSQSGFLYDNVDSYLWKKDRNFWRAPCNRIWTFHWG